jgi:hypothetical protein
MLGIYLLEQKSWRPQWQLQKIHKKREPNRTNIQCVKKPVIYIMIWNETVHVVTGLCYNVSVAFLPNKIKT